MQKTIKILLFILPVITLAVSSCLKIESLPPVPKIEYKSFEVFDTIDILGNHAKGGRLKFYFEDGDGDVGMNPPSGEVTDTNNLFITFYRKKGGIWRLGAEDDPLKPSDFRIPYMEREGQNKILKGVISVTFLYLFYTPYDTIRYDFYIVDRANNPSNELSTEEIVINGK
jgi:hypothetical protein